jgi:hypothetical protein
VQYLPAAKGTVMRREFKGFAGLSSGGSKRGSRQKAGRKKLHGTES